MIGAAVAGKIECDAHGEQTEAFVCHHLADRDAVGLGFNRDEPAEDNPFPDAWCDDCEIIRVAHDGWDRESEKLADIKMVCSACYNRIRIRHTRTATTLADLDGLRWKCSSCEEWHTGPALDFTYDTPHYWREEYAGKPGCLLDDSFCKIEDRDFFVRGLIHLPILGTAETLRWGVWGSLKRENFEKLLEMDDDPKRVELEPMFSWLSSQIPEYPETLSLKMYAHIQPVGFVPHFELEHTDHPLAKEYHHGIAPERVKEIMLRRLRQAGH